MLVADGSLAISAPHPNTLPQLEDRIKETLLAHVQTALELAKSMYGVRKSPSTKNKERRRGSRVASGKDEPPLQAQIDDAHEAGAVATEELFDYPAQITLLRAQFAWQRAVERCFRRAESAEEARASKAASASHIRPVAGTVLPLAAIQASETAAVQSLMSVQTELRMQATTLATIATRDLGRASRIVLESLCAMSIAHR